MTIESETGKDNQNTTNHQPERSGYLRKPEWLRVKANVGSRNTAVMAMLRQLNLHTVCEEALCPNCGSCFDRKTAAFLILGDQCTRDCRFCSVAAGCPQPPDPEEPEHLAEACARLELRHVVVTSVTRDDLADGGADHYVQVIRAIRNRLGGQAPVIEVLIPDLAGNWVALGKITDAAPQIINHNVETIPRLYPDIRPGARYERSLELLAQVRRLAPAITTKSGLMVGLGETETEIADVLHDLRKAGCDMITIGQYLTPSRKHAPVVAYIEPVQFDRYARISRELGFRSVASGPLVRSSYMADQAYDLLDPAKNIDAVSNQS
jgi:lipoic acid synthetase